MRQILMLTCGILFISSVGFAEDTTTETCANGAGTVITGVVSGHKYCKSNTNMTWWNAHAWCDALGRRLFSLDDCEYSSTGTTGCNDLKGGGGNSFVWTATPNGNSSAYRVNFSTGVLSIFRRASYDVYGNYALCY